jgi:hypothetical protein
VLSTTVSILKITVRKLVTTGNLSGFVQNDAQTQHGIKQDSTNIIWAEKQQPWFILQNCFSAVSAKKGGSMPEGRCFGECGTGLGKKKPPCRGGLSGAGSAYLAAAAM